MARWNKVPHEKGMAKLEIYMASHQLASSLSVHEHALESGLRVPELFEVKNVNNKIYKYSEWVNGDTIDVEMDRNDDMIEPICEDLARYINEMFDVDGISPADNEFRHFVWTDGQVVYVDMKKLMKVNEGAHISQMAKLCIKSCGGDVRKAIAFLKGYNKYRPVKPVLKECDKRRWSWYGTRMPRRIRLKEVLNG
jgi:tRNA A-37 threonylcarbamoyl transferase component Bud32